MMISLCMWCVSGKNSGLPDEVFTTCVIKRYYGDQWDDSSVAVVAAFDGVQGTSVLVDNSLITSLHTLDRGLNKKNRKKIRKSLERS
ncbi:hypothetical protein Tco_0675722 [Tanacetum coccineum]